jgi:hypothetical protein
LTEGRCSWQRGRQERLLIYRFLEKIMRVEAGKLGQGSAQNGLSCAFCTLTNESRPGFSQPETGPDALLEGFLLLHAS